MADTPATGETAAAPSNGTPAPVTPISPTDTNGGSEDAKLKEQLAQQARANQLANEELKRLKEEKEARDKADSDAKAKKLEEENQFKELYEQEKAKREAAEADKAESDRKAEIRKAKAEILGEHDDSVRQAAEEFGIDLANDSEEAKADFKDKVQKLADRVASTNRVTPNNPRATQTTPELTGEQLRTVLQDDDKFAEYVSDPKRFPVLSQMTRKPS